VEWDEALREATNAYVSADYPAVIRWLEPFTEPARSAQIPSPERLRLFQLYALGCLLQSPPLTEAARGALRQIVRLQPDFVFAEGLATPEAVQLLEDVRAELGVRPPQSQGGGTIYIQREVIENPLWLAFLPFGAGQFQNRQTSKGVIFLLLETSALGVNITSYTVVEQLRGANGFIRREDASLARGFQNAQFVSLGVFALLALGGIFDAWYFYQPEFVEIRTLPGPPAELGGRPNASTLPLPGLDAPATWGWAWEF
jgi:hypothetical protein